MIEPQTKSIDGRTFTVAPLPAMRQYKLMTRLAKRLGPGLGPALGGLFPQLQQMKGVDLRKVDLAALLPALGALFDQLDPDEAEAVLKELLQTSLIDGKPLLPVFDAELQGKMGTILKLLGFALEVNYGGFFGGLDGAGTGLLQQLLSRSATSSTSPGPSSA